MIKSESSSPKSPRRNKEPKESLIKILKKLDFEAIYDFDKIVEEKKIYEGLDSIDFYEINKLIKDYTLSIIIRKEYTNDRKLNIINRVLELKHEVIIETLTKYDELGEGYRIKKMVPQY